MRGLINTLRNIYKIEDLRNKIIATLSLILIYRLGAHVVIPGIDPTQLGAFQEQAGKGILGLINMFSGGAFANASVFALGIMPYISASIVIQLLGMAVPYFQRLQKEGESGRKKINQITRLLTVAITLGQAPGYLANLHAQIPASAFAMQSSVWIFWFSSVIVLVAGTMFTMWLGERITDKGIGNGISLLIMIGIIARLPQSFVAEFLSRTEAQGGGMIVFIAEMVVMFVVFVATIALVQAVRRIPVQYAKRIVGNKQYGGARQYIPLKVNAAGVMPIIFAQALMFIPMMLAGFNTDATTGIAAAFADFTGFWYNFTFGIMVVLFTYFYTAITVNPTQMAEDMKKNGGFIPGIKPGKKTVEFLDTVMSRITLPGSVFLALVAILPAFAMIAGINNQFAAFFGGTSLLILVGVVLDTLQQIESHLLMRHYDGLMKSGRIAGRTGATASGM